MKPIHKKPIYNNRTIFRAIKGTASKLTFEHFYKVEAAIDMIKYLEARVKELEQQLEGRQPENKL